MTNHHEPGGALVYSTESGRMCPACRKPVAQCACRSKAPPPATDGVVRVSRETKGRGGKGVTVIKGVPLDGAALLSLGKQLRTTCGTGGTVKDGAIELQGDHCERAIAALKAQGWQVRRSGG
jgi:translation initiation factor 1